MAFAAALAWASWPLPPTPIVDVDVTAPTASDSMPATVAPLDRGAFAARIWNPPPQAEAVVSAPTAEPAPAALPTLQLIGIAHDTDTDGHPVLRAALYDPTSDKLHLVASGERIGNVTVAEVDGQGVSLAYGGRTSRLRLRDEREGGKR